MNLGPRDPLDAHVMPFIFYTIDRTSIRVDENQGANIVMSIVNPLSAHDCYILSTALLLSALIETYVRAIYCTRSYLLVQQNSQF